MPKRSLVLAWFFLNIYLMILPQCAEIIMHAICSCQSLTIGVCLQQLANYLDGFQAKKMQKNGPCQAHLLFLSGKLMFVLCLTVVFNHHQHFCSVHICCSDKQPPTAAQVTCMMSKMSQVSEQRCSFQCFGFNRLVNDLEVNESICKMYSNHVMIALLLQSSKQCIHKMITFSSQCGKTLERSLIFSQTCIYGDRFCLTLKL